MPFSTKISMLLLLLNLHLICTPTVVSRFYDITQCCIPNLTRASPKVAPSTFILNNTAWDTCHTTSSIVSCVSILSSQFVSLTCRKASMRLTVVGGITMYHLVTFIPNDQPSWLNSNMHLLHFGSIGGLTKRVRFMNFSQCSYCTSLIVRKISRHNSWQIDHNFKAKKCKIHIQINGSTRSF